MSLIIRSMDDLHERLRHTNQVICLFSGGLDGSYLLARIAQMKRPGTKVYALTVNLGGGEDVQRAMAMARKFGAHPIEAKKGKEFVLEYVLPSIQAHATYLGTHPISASLSRPLLARVAFEYAEKLGCDTIIHTANSSQNSLRRFNGALRELGFQGVYGSPYESSVICRAEKQEYLKAAGTAQFNKRGHSVDANIWCREFESGDFDDPRKIEVPESMYLWTKGTGGTSAVRDAGRAKKNLSKISKSETLVLEFKEGVPIKLNGRKIDLDRMIRDLNSRAGKYGLGRYIGLEENGNHVKFLEIREMPAAHVFFTAYRFLESAALPAETIRKKMNQEQIWVREAVEGRWYGSLHRASQAFIQSVAKHVTGEVKFRLSFKELQLVSLSVKKPVYGISRSEFEERVANEKLSPYEPIRKHHTN